MSTTGHFDFIHLVRIATAAALVLGALVLGVLAGVASDGTFVGLVLLLVAGSVGLWLLTKPVGIGVVLALPFLIPSLPTPLGLVSPSMQLALIMVVLTALWWAYGAGRPALPWWAVAAAVLLPAWSIGANFIGSFELEISIAWMLLWPCGIVLGAGMSKNPEAIYGLAPIFAFAAGIAVLEATGWPNQWAVITGANGFTELAGGTGAKRSLATFGHPLIAGAMLGAAALMMLSRKRPVLVVIGLLCVAGCLATVSRSAMIGVAVATLVLMWIERRNLRLVLPMTLAGALAAAAIVSFVPAVNESFNSRVVNNKRNESIRAFALDTATARLRYAPETVVLGGGIGSTWRFLEARGGVRDFIIFDNQYATALFDFGLIPSFLAFGMVAFALASGGHRQSKREAAPAAVVLLVAYAFADAAYWAPTSLMLAIQVGLACAPERGEELDARAARRSAAREAERGRVLLVKAHLSH